MGGALMTEGRRGYRWPSYPASQPGSGTGDYSGGHACLPATCLPPPACLPPAQQPPASQLSLLGDRWGRRAQWVAPRAPAVFNLQQPGWPQGHGQGLWIQPAPACHLPGDNHIPAISMMC